MFSVTGICSSWFALTTAVAVFSIPSTGLKIPISAVIAGIASVVQDSLRSSNTFLSSILTVSSIPATASSVLGLVVVPVVPGLVVAPGVAPSVVEGSVGICVLSPVVLFSLGIVVFSPVWLLSSSLPVAGKFCTCSCSAAAASPLSFKNTATPVAEAPIKTKDTSPITTFFVFKNFFFILTSIKIFK